MVSLNTIITLGGIGAAYLLFTKLGGGAGIGSAIGSQISGFTEALGGQVTQAFNRFGNLVETPQSNAPNTAARVVEELELYRSRNLYPILRALIYIIDTMRKHKLVWGVGRGSSVASYVLYLLGIHKVDSLKYNLNIKEFLKDE